MGKMGTTGTVQLSSGQEQWECVVVRSKDSWGRVGGLEGALLLTVPPMEGTGRPTKSAYLLWPTSQVSLRSAIFSQHVPSSLAFSFQHFEQREPVDEKRQHSWNFQTLPSLTMLIYILVDCASVLSADQNLFFARQHIFASHAFVLWESAFLIRC